MRHGSLFSGIGGFDLAAEWMGWENVFHCEWNEFGQKVLKHYWPNAISYGDITKTDFTIHRGGIDIITGGFPCQPFSMAGKRKGTEDERHLWPEMLRVIREIQPRYVVGENVSGLINWDGGVVFEQVQADLETEGYEVQAYILPACGVNAPHRRDRVWFVAHTQLHGHDDGTATTEQCGVVADTDELNGDLSGFRAGKISQFKEAGVCNDIVAYTNSGIGCKGGVHKTQPGEATRHTGTRNARSYERNTWDNFQTQPPVCCGNDGIPSGLAGITVSKHRNESIKAYGNAIVPQVVYQIFKAIEKFESCQKF